MLLSHLPSSASPAWSASWGLPGWFTAAGGICCSTCSPCTFSGRSWSSISGSAPKAGGGSFLDILLRLCLSLQAYVSSTVSLRSTPPKAKALGTSLLPRRGWHGFQRHRLGKIVLFLFQTITSIDSQGATTIKSICQNGEALYEGLDMESMNGNSSHHRRKYPSRTMVQI